MRRGRRAVPARRDQAHGASRTFRRGGQAGGRIATVLAAAAALLTGLTGCAPQHGGDPLERETVPAERLDHASVHPTVAAVAMDTAVGFRGPGDRAFWVARRTPEIEAYPCAECHEPARPATGDVDSHADMAATTIHPERVDAECNACHDPDDRSLLRGRSGATYGLDEAYRLCAECHFQQAEDWAAGAHGKRMGAWEGRRVVMSCTACHDPHDPAFPHRIPAPGPRIPRTGGTNR